jgi:5-oxoprolinase (ATP-hydrolysing)
MLKELSLSQGLDTIDFVSATDLMDDGSQIKLKLTIDRNTGSAIFDFEGTDPEMYGNCNAPKSITSSAIIYCLRCLVNSDIPLNQGCLNPI